MSTNTLKRSLSSPDLLSSNNNKRAKTIEHKLPTSAFGVSAAAPHCVAGDLYNCEDTEFDELRVTDYNCKFLKDFSNIAKKGDVADSVHHDLEYGIMDITLNNKIYKIKTGHFFYGDIEVIDLGSDKWDGSLANIPSKEEEEDTTKIFEYKFRAECRADVDAFFKMFKRPQIIKSTITQDDLPDCYVTFSSKLDILHFRSCMQDIPDGHVMLESLNYASKYTGERYFTD